MNWITASLVMFVSSVALYLCVRRSNTLKTPQQLNNLAMFQLALAISAVFGGFLANWSFTLVVWLNVIPGLIKLVVTLLLAEPQKRPTLSSNIYNHLYEAVQLFIHNKELRIFSVTAMFSYALR